MTEWLRSRLPPCPFARRCVRFMTSPSARNLPPLEMFSTCCTAMCTSSPGVARSQRRTTAPATQAGSPRAARESGARLRRAGRHARRCAPDPTYTAALAGPPAAPTVHRCGVEGMGSPRDGHAGSPRPLLASATSSAVQSYARCPAPPRHARWDGLSRSCG